VAFGIFGLQRRGHRRFELVIAGMLAVILAGFPYETLQIGGDPDDIAAGLIPGFAGTESVLLAPASSAPP